jgi:hypothetical protein
MVWMRHQQEATVSGLAALNQSVSSSNSGCSRTPKAEQILSPADSITEAPAIIDYVVAVCVVCRDKPRGACAPLQVPAAADRPQESPGTSPGGLAASQAAAGAEGLGCCC